MHRYVHVKYLANTSHYYLIVLCHLVRAFCERGYNSCGEVRVMTITMMKVSRCDNPRSILEGSRGSLYQGNAILYVLNMSDPGQFVGVRDRHGFNLVGGLKAKKRRIDPTGQEWIYEDMSILPKGCMKGVEWLEARISPHSPSLSLCLSLCVSLCLSVSLSTQGLSQ